MPSTERVPHHAAGKAPEAFTRRCMLLGSALSLAFPSDPSRGEPAGHPHAHWYAAAESMRQLAISWGDQAYGAVLVLGDDVVGNGPSRVIRDRNPDAHAERVAILDARRRLERDDLAGAVLYSTSRPCAACEDAAARAGVARMYHGPALADAGSPRSR